VLVHLAEDALGHLRGLHQGDHVILCHKAPASTEGAFALSRCAHTITASKGLRASRSLVRACRISGGSSCSPCGSSDSAQTLRAAPTSSCK
jgi:hypothetical protein